MEIQVYIAHCFVTPGKMSVGHQGQAVSKVLTKRNGRVNEEARLLSGDENAKNNA